MKLSIVVVTYNQDKYIRTCLDSILMQEIDVDYEVLVADDCSTDSTPQICDEYGALHPQFKIFHHKKNIGLLQNWEFVMNRCEGEYIAILEGDDYWIQSDKLKKQISFLDTHKEFSAVFTRAKIHYMDEGAEVSDERYLPSLEEREYSEREICERFIVLSSSLMFRNCLCPIHYTDQLLYADLYTFILLSKKGKMYCIGEQTAAYRIHKNNLSRLGGGKYWVACFNQDRYFIKQFPEVADIFQEHLDACWSQLFYDKTIPAWKYRMLYMLQYPRMLFSRFALKTIKSYILPF